MKAIRILSVITCAFLAASCSRLSDTAPEDDGWVALFDGKTFDGWEFDVLENAAPETIWSIEDGVIICRGQDKPAGILRTKESYSDFELQLEWRWPTKPGNSGVLIHASEPRFMSVWPRSIEVQLFHENAGDFWVIGQTIEVGAEQIPDNPKQERRKINLTDGAEKPPGEWNHMRILAAGNTVTVFVNDQLVNEGTNASTSSGAICLQAERADVDFRNIRLRPIENRE